MDRISWFLLLLLSLLWGSSFFLVGIIVKELPPLTIVFARVSLAFLTLLPIFWYYGHKFPKTLTSWKPFIGMGLLNNIFPFSLLFFGQTQISVGLTSIINAMTPLFTVIVMVSFKEENLTFNRVIGVALGVIGVFILQGFDSGIDNSQTLGICLCLGATLSYAFSALWGKKFLNNVPPLKSATCQLACSSAIIIFFTVIIDQPWILEMPNHEIWISLFSLSFFGTAIAYLIFYKILVTSGASNVMLVTLLIPVTAVLLGNIYLNEAIFLQEIIGGSIIGLGLLFIDGRILKFFLRNSNKE